MNEKINTGVRLPVHERLQPSEVLLFCCKSTSVLTIPGGIICFIVGLFFLFTMLNNIHRDLPTAIFGLIISAFLLWYAIHQFFRAGKNIYYMTDKRLVIYENRAFGKTIKLDVPLNNIANISATAIRSRRRTGTGRIRLTIQMNNGVRILINPTNKRHFADVVTKAINTQSLG
jgi:hypothetical protein